MLQETDHTELIASLKALRFHYTAENLSHLHGSLSGRSPLEIINHLATLETVERKKLLADEKEKKKAVKHAAKAAKHVAKAAKHIAAVKAIAKKHAAVVKAIVKK